MAEREAAVLGIFHSRPQLEKCVDALWTAGFRGHDISVLARNHHLAKELTEEMHTRAPGHPAEDAGTGATVGIELGATLGMLAGFGALGIPGMGPFIAAGPILSFFAGAGIGAAAGGIAGALIGMGVSEYHATRYGDRVKAGAILLAIHSDSPEWKELAREILERNGAEDVSPADEGVLGLHSAAMGRETLHP
jgi:hypothetical protein